MTGSNCTGDHGSIHNDGSATTDNSGRGHWAASHGSVGGQARVLGFNRY